MSSPYNLRNKQKKLHCYLQDRKLSPSFKPVVVMGERVPDIPSTCRFYVTKNDEMIVKKVVKGHSKGFNPMMFFTFIIFLIFSLSLYHYQENVKNYIISKYCTFTPLTTYIANDTSEIRNFVLNALDEAMEKEEEEEEDENEEEDERSMSFIQEQCLRSEDRTGLDNDSVTDVNDSELLTDYALEYKGAKIVSIFDTKPYGFVSLKIWDFDISSIFSDFYQNYFYHKTPYRILNPWSKPGDCWAFKGSHGKVRIELWDQIRISAITIDHIRKEDFSVNDISSAPKTISVAASENENSELMYLGSFEYTITGPSVQTFPISPTLMKNPCKFVELTIKSNHGNRDYTCLYRVRVHGRN